MSDVSLIGSFGPKNRWQKKVMSTDITTDTTITELGFSNLEVGKHYEIKLNLTNIAAQDDSAAVVRINHDGNILTELGMGNGAAEVTDKASAGRAGVSVIFKATATTLTFTTTSINAGSRIEAENSSAILIERNDLEDEVSIW